MCRCPAHDDGTASLKVTERNGKLLVHCHAGCTQEDVIAKLRERGLWPARERHRLRPTSETEQENEQDDGRAILRQVASVLRKSGYSNKERPTEYLKARGIDNVPDCALLLPKTDRRCPAMFLPVVNADGDLQGFQLTFLNKRGTDKLASDMPRQNFGSIKGGYVPLFAVDPNKPLIVAEGVETALAAAQITGYAAISALSAANLANVKTPPSSEIIIAADNDPAGRKAADALAQRLAGRKVRIAIPDGPKGYDWNDALLDHPDMIDEFRNEIVRAKLVKTSDEVTALTMGQFLDLDFPERPYLLGKWLVSSGLVMIHAQRGAGKTWFALSVAYAVATGRPLMNWTVEKVAKVLYVDGELPGKHLQKRLRQLGPETPNLMLLSPDMFRVRGKMMPDLGGEAGRDFLDAFIERHHIDLVILDSLSTLIRTGFENDADQWAPIQEWALGHRSRGRTIVYLHHEGRSGKARGTSKKEDVLDTMIGLRSRPELVKGNESVFDLTFTKSREFFGDDAKRLVMKLAIGEDGLVRWSSQTAEQDKKERVKELRAQGWKNVDIAKELGLTAGRVSQIMKELKLEKDAA